jgi:uncharacterized protein YhaN
VEREQKEEALRQLEAYERREDSQALLEASLEQSQSELRELRAHCQNLTEALANKDREYQCCLADVKQLNEALDKEREGVKLDTPVGSPLAGLLFPAEGVPPVCGMS